jgi:hypothetical protein
MHQVQIQIHLQGEEDEVKEQPKDISKSKTEFPSFISLEFIQLPEIGY